MKSQLQPSHPPIGALRRMALLLSIAIGTWPAIAQDGPANHRVLLATSGDGLDWVVQPEPLAEHASVPELFLDPEGRPTILFVDASGTSERLGALQRDAGGMWRRVGTNLREVDPNVVRLADGSYRAYVKAGLDGAVAAYSSNDGLNWRALGEVFRDARYANATDPDVFETPDGWVMLISLGAKLLRCTSPDGLKFSTDGTLLELGGSVSDTVKIPGGWRQGGGAGDRTGCARRGGSGADSTSRWLMAHCDQVVHRTTHPGTCATGAAWGHFNSLGGQRDQPGRNDLDAGRGHPFCACICSGCYQ